jgi:heptosyltransferase-3
VRLKQVEIAGRQFLIRAGASLLPRPLGSLVLSPARSLRILLHRHETIGDMIIATGVIRAVATAAPGIRVDVLASRRNAPVLDGNPDVSRVIVLDERERMALPHLLGELARSRYDVVVDMLTGKPSSTTLLMMLAARARHRVGLPGRGNERVFTRLVRRAPEHAPLAEQWGAVAAAFGVDVERFDFRPTIVLTALERANANAVWLAEDGREPSARVLINISTNDPKRRWPEDRFAAAVRHVSERHPEARVLVMGPPDDAAAAARIAAAGSGTAITPGLRDAMAVAATAQVILTPDTSISHVASAFQVPLIVMRQRDFEKYAPYRTPGRIITSETDRVEDIPIERITAALDELLGAKR